MGKAKKEKENNRYGPLKIDPVPVPKSYKHPDAPFDVLPNHEFVTALVSPKGAGKTTLICRMLEAYKGYFHQIYIFSPTVLSDEKWDWLKQQKLLIQNIALKKWIKKEQQRRQGAFKDQVVQDPPLGIEFDRRNTNEEEEFDGKIPEENFFHIYTDKELELILDRQKAEIDALKKHGQPKYLADRICIIFDDQVGSSLFSNTRHNYFTGINTRHRHYSTSMVIVSQGYKEIPKTIRANFTCLILFDIANDKEVEVIYEENTMGLKREQWLQLFNHAVKEPFSFLFLNGQKEKGKRAYMRFEKLLQVTTDDDIVDPMVQEE